MHVYSLFNTVRSLSLRRRVRVSSSCFFSAQSLTLAHAREGMVCVSVSQSVSQSIDTIPHGTEVMMVWAMAEAICEVAVVCYDTVPQFI